MKPILHYLFAFLFLQGGFAQNPPSWDFDQQLWDYFSAETQRIEATTASETASIDDWEAYREQARNELLDMLGLNPLPERTPLQAVVTGTTEHEEFRVEKVHFQAGPGLYVTGNLYVPKNAEGKMPAILAAPRPLLISNSDQDPIFPIDGVFRTYMKTRGVYKQLDAEPQIALNTVSGGHQDVQELRVHAFRWFNHHLLGHDELIEAPAVKFFEPEQLRVFDELPEDEINTRIDEVFVPQAPPAVEVIEEIGWVSAAGGWRKVIDNYAFAKESPVKLVKKHRI